MTDFVHVDRSGDVPSETVVLIRGQRKAHSFAEACLNVAIGYSVALVSQLVVFPLYDINVSLSTNLAIGAWFTVISIVRSYVVRRAFNRWGSR